MRVDNPDIVYRVEGRGWRLRGRDWRRREWEEWRWDDVRILIICSLLSRLQCHVPRLINRWTNKCIDTQGGSMRRKKIEGRRGEVNTLVLVLLKSPMKSPLRILWISGVKQNKTTYDVKLVRRSLHFTCWDKAEATWWVMKDIIMQIVGNVYHINSYEVVRVRRLISDS